MTETTPQLLHLVIGGELSAPTSTSFKDLTAVEFVGAYASYEEAKKAWRSKAQSTVDNALMRYYVIHAHKLLNPAND
ncbi:DUF4170 domain-containing protein [Asticcacaulis tiandongensis]|uniref:DUF4170 domain-containing protein n=1 Tax=Asticcacaulis tiandongensis TaxID=2565365 RepID=UPI0011282FE5|nr:DUF4170 domain-containing protein [Asticcacaulis tiandongensis]